MTWEDKLYQILGIQPKEFDTDSEIGSWIDEPIHQVSNTIEDAISTGNLKEVNAQIQVLNALYSNWRRLLNHLKNNPKCVDYTRGENNCRWSHGIFRLGYRKYPEGIEGVRAKMLYFSRLIRDAEKRTLKHPRFKNSYLHYKN